MKKIISATQALDGAAVDNSILTLPARFKGLVRRLRVRNDSGAQRTLNFNDMFTPDASAGAPTPGAQTVERWRMIIANAATETLDGTENPIFKLLNNFRVVTDVASAAIIVTYTIELE
jgi:hypothetical protein